MRVDYGVPIPPHEEKPAVDRSKLTIARLMLWVAVIAVDAAVLRFAREGGIVREYTSLFGVLALSIQVGFLRALSRGRGARVFWCGYAVGGVGAALSWLWYLLASPGIRPPILSAFWKVYPDWMAAPPQAIPWLGRLVYGNRAAFEAWNTIMPFLPLGLSGFVTGAFAQIVDRRDMARALASASGNGPADPDG
jgi:hypothetical protein